MYQLPENLSIRSKKRLGVVAAVVLLAGSAFGYPRVRALFDDGAVALVFHEVQRERIELSLMERGRLESQSNERVYSRVEDIRGDGIIGNAIVDIVKNGAMVKEGDLIVTPDSGTHLERVDEQVIETDQARAAFLEAEVLYKNQVSINETLAAQAGLAVRLAELELAMFEHPDNGTFRLEVDAIKRLIDDTENELLAAKAKLQLSSNDKEGLEQLFRMGYSGKSELDRVRLDYLQAQSGVTAKLNRLETHLANLKKKDVFDYEVSKLTLEGNLNTAKQTLNQVELDNSAELSKAKVEMDAARRVLEKEEELLERYRKHLANCKIYAPKDGMAVHAMQSYSRQPKVELGATIWEGQQILSLPDLAHMQVITSVHETSRNLVEAGMSAMVRLEAFPDRNYRATVKRVDLMPDRRGWDNDTKVYKTIVTIDEEVEGLKPGLTAIVEFRVDDIPDAVAVPVESILYDNDDPVCYVKIPGGLERRVVKLGVSSRNRAQVLEGIVPGEEVVTNPGQVAKQ